MRGPSSRRFATLGVAVLATGAVITATIWSSSDAPRGSTTSAATASAEPSARPRPGPSSSATARPVPAPTLAAEAEATALREARRQLRAFPAEWPIVRGVYSTMWSFAGSRWHELMDLVRTTEVNAIVIDVKDDAGMLAWNDSDVAVARETGAGSHTALSRDAATRRIRELREAGGYPIARVVCFKDPIAAPAKPELAIRTAGGDVWRDRKGMAWLDANQQEAWDYIIDIGREAARMGFLEVQFDYVRFPTDGNVSTAVYRDGGGVDPARIRAFLAYAREELHAEGVRISADIFGLTTYKREGEGDGDGTGQLFEDVISEVDYVSPMVYPSHYYPGNYGLADPESAPYEVVVNAMREAQERVAGYRAKVRPWLEDFSLTVPHHPDRVGAQLRATYENGIESWLLWNAGNRYSRAALGPDEVSRALSAQVPEVPVAEPPDAPIAPEGGG